MELIGARETSLEAATLEEALAFIGEHHRQGLATPGKNPKAYALTHEQRIVAVALFCNPRTAGMQKRYTTELFRLAFHRDVRVRGGASKLIRGFMKSGAWDLFTYQDTAGEGTDVYELAGMTLVGSKNPKPKTILVKNGLTAETATNNRRDWFSMEQVVAHGPDRLLGTKLGIQLNASDERKSNVELFLELGYHLEEVPGDRIYEWRNPAVWFYTYKLTSTKDDGYYIGRHVMRGEKSAQAAQQDPHMGSGGKKFQNWLEEVGFGSLKKEIINLHSTWEEAVAAEKALIGDAHRIDPLCMNSQPGGTGVTRLSPVYITSFCEAHGQSLYRKGRCVSCRNEAMISLKLCELHGESKHRGSACVKCTARKALNTRLCPKHGMTLHQKDKCSLCVTQKAFGIKVCSTHGETAFQGSKCLLCASSDRDSLQECSLHGQVLHRGGRCMTCVAQDSFSEKACPKHGLTKHRGSTCMKCSYEKGQRSIELCEVHGETSHVGGRCWRCLSKENLTERLCATHGLTLHKGGSCAKCTAARAFEVQECPTHGEVKFSKGVCVKCRLSRSIEQLDCPTHGMTSHRAGKCVKCSYKKTVTFGPCPVHGEDQKHRSGRCLRCSADKGRASRKSSGL